MKIRTLIAAIVALFGLALATTAPAEAHPITEARAVCQFIEHSTFGPEPNGVSRYAEAVHWWGSHQAHCCFYTPSNSAEFLYDLVTGANAWINTSWC